jgi:insulysin
MEIIKPKFDKRIFKGGILKNKVKYICIEDDNMDKSYVSVCVKTGTFNNMKEYEGLAHFLEHMLFMGSTKYPSEDHYFSRLNALGGYSNAYTDKFDTVYYFNVYNEGLNEIFDIFSRFFIDPLFNKNSVNREVNAVNSEHEKNKNNDQWRAFQLLLNLANKDSQINTFGNWIITNIK